MNIIILIIKNIHIIIKTKSKKYYFKFTLGSKSYDSIVNSAQLITVSLANSGGTNLSYQIRQNEFKKFWNKNNKSNVYIHKSENTRIISFEEEIDGFTKDSKSSKNKTVTVIGKKDVIGSEYKALSSICSDNKVKNIFKFLGNILNVIKILVPLGLMIFGAISFAKAMISGDDDALKKSAVGFIWKLIAAVVIFVVPTVINLIINVVDEDSKSSETYAKCSTCLFDPKNC